jgi:hypothetical protein
MSWAIEGDSMIVLRTAMGIRNHLRGRWRAY